MTDPKCCLHDRSLYERDPVQMDCFVVYTKLDRSLRRLMKIDKSIVS
jgi:hypothetical protein